MTDKPVAAHACSCVRWIQSLPIPNKIIIFKCSQCETEFTLYPNGEIAYEQRQ